MSTHRIQKEYPESAPMTDLRLSLFFNLETLRCIPDLLLGPDPPPLFQESGNRKTTHPRITMPAVEEPIIVIPSSSSEELGEAGGRGRGGGRGGGGAGTREKSEAGTPNNKSSASVRPRQSTSNNNNKKKKTMGKKLKNTEEEEEEDGNEVESSVKKAAASSSSSSSPASLGAGGVPNGLSSSCSFPMSRVRRLVVGSDGARRGAAIRPTHETVFLANKAAELFLELFAEDAYKCARRERKKHLSYKHLSTNVKAKKKYEFLSDFVPDKLKDEDALKAREMVEL